MKYDPIHSNTTNRKWCAHHLSFGHWDQEGFAQTRRLPERSASQTAWLCTPQFQLNLRRSPVSQMDIDHHIPAPVLSWHLAGSTTWQQTHGNTWDLHPPRLHAIVSTAIHHPFDGQSNTADETEIISDRIVQVIIKSVIQYVNWYWLTFFGTGTPIMYIYIYIYVLYIFISILYIYIL